MQIIKIFLLLFLILSCQEKKIVKNISINKTQKVKVVGDWSSEYKISYLWSKPQGPKNHNSKWIVNDDIMLFTPYKKGDYLIKVSIENSMGEILGKETFNYHVVDKKNKSIELKKQPPEKTNKKKKNGVYNIQVSSWVSFEDAKKDMDRLNKLGFNSYIDKKIINEKIWYRVRIGEYLSYNESVNIKKQLEKKRVYNSWINKE